MAHAERDAPPRNRTLIVRPGEPVYVMPLADGGEMYVVGDEPLDDEGLRGAVEEALSLAGAWSDLDWDDPIKALDRIRHESKPTPPIDDL